MEDAFLGAVENLSRFHREHEKFYAQSPRAEAVVVQRHARALCSLALAEAMATTWDIAPALLDYPALADVLGDRHRIIANDWQAASMTSLAGRLLHRGVDIVERVDLSLAALRTDLAGARSSASTIYAGVELLDRAADLLSDSAGLVHDNEHRWRRFRARLALVLDAEPEG